MEYSTHLKFITSTSALYSSQIQRYTWNKREIRKIHTIKWTSNDNKWYLQIFAPHFLLHCR